MFEAFLRNSIDGSGADRGARVPTTAEALA